MAITITRHIIDNHGIPVSYLEAGSGSLKAPLIVLCHGFPGLAYSWRYQLEAFANAGYHVVAPDMRGYGESGKPTSIEKYSLDHIRSDMLALLDALGAAKAIFAGHDFGAPVVWNLALENPERVAGLVVLSVPYDFDYYGRRGQGHAGDAEPETCPTEQFAAYARQTFLHAHYFQDVARADKELGENTATFLRRIFWALSAGGDLLGAFGAAKPGMSYINVLAEPASALPWTWLDQPAMDVYVEAYKTGGFNGPLNWYRVVDINWQLNRRYLGRKINTPALFIAGEKDPVITMSGPDAMDIMKTLVTGLKKIVLLPNAGHWVQQEQAQAVSDQMLDFIRAL